MNNKIRMISGCCVAVSIMAMTAVVSQKDANYIACNPTTAKLDTRLPLSHPKNRCALQQQNDVSWASWIAGHNQGVEFHFLDLLELLSRQTDKPGKSITPE